MPLGLSGGGGPSVVSTQSVSFSVGNATKFVILNPVDGTVDGPILVTVQAQDQFGNNNLTYGGSVTLVTTGSATGGGVVSIVTGSGQRSISDQLAQTVGLSLSGGSGLNTSHTADVIFSAGAATKLVIQDIANSTVDAAVTAYVQAQDQFSNLNTSYSGSVNFVTSGTVVTGAGVVTLTSGVGSSAIGTQITQTVGLFLTGGGGLDNSSTKNIVFGAGVVTKFVILNPTDGTVDLPITVNVQAQDQYGNKNTGFTGSVTLTTSGTATGGGSVSITSGEGSRAISDQLAETVNLGLSGGSGGLNTSSIADVIFGFGAANKFVILNPVDGTVDNSIPVTVQAQDQFGNLNPTYNGTVTLTTIGSSATGGGLITLINGFATVSISDTLAQTVVLALTGGSGLTTSSSQDVIFLAGAVTQFVIIDPANGTTDSAVNVTVEARDQHNNKNLTYGVDVTLNASGGNNGAISGGGVVDIINGSGFRSISSTVNQTVALSLTDSAPTGKIVTSTQDVIFNYGVPNKIAILDPTDGTVDSPIVLTVQVQDFNSNVVSNYNNFATLVTTGSAGGHGVFTITNGAASINLTDTVAETVMLSLSDSSNTSLIVTSNQNVVFSPGSPTQYMIQNPNDGTVDAPIAVRVIAADQFGNMVPSFQNDVTLISSSVTTTGAGTVPITNGEGTLNLSDTMAETVNLSLGNLGGGLTVSSTQNVIFSFGAPNKILILDPVDGTTDDPILVSLRVEDAHSNLVANYTGTVTLNATGSVTGKGTVNFTNGVGSMSLSDPVVETTTLSINNPSTAGLTLTSTQSLYYGPGTPSKFTILQPAPGSVDGLVTVTVQAQDFHGNLTPSYQTDVTLTTTGAATGGGVVAITNGQGTIDIGDTVVQSVTLGLSNSPVSGLTKSDTKVLTFTNGSPTHFFIANPIDGTVDNPVTVYVYVRDQFNNTVTSYQPNVTLTVDGFATRPAAGLVDIVNGVGQIDVSDLKAETVTLGLTDTQGTNLTVAGVTENIVFGFGAPRKFFINNPADGTTDAGITVTVEALDVGNNRVTTYDNYVRLVVDGNASSSGDIHIINGVGTRVITDTRAQTVNLSLLDLFTTNLTVTSTENVVFAPGVPSQFVIIEPVDGTVDAPIVVRVEVQDAGGNMTPSYSLTNAVILNANSGATGSGNVTISSGFGTKSFSKTVTGSVVLSLADAGAGLSLGVNKNVLFAPGAATQFVLDNPTDGTVDNPIDITVRAFDQYSNAATNHQSDVTLVASGGHATGAGIMDVVNGVGYLSLTDRTAETVNLSLLNGGAGITITSTQDVIFGFGSATKFTILDPIDTNVLGSAVVTVKAQDNWNNTVTSYVNDVRLTTDGQATGFGIVDITNGSGSLTISDHTAEIVTLHLVDQYGTNLNVSSTQNVSFANGPATQFYIIDPLDGATDRLVAVTVEARDLYNNKVIDYSNDVTLNSTGSVSGDGVVINISGGAGNLTLSDNISETVTLSLADTQSTGLNVTNTQTVFFDFGTPTKIVILQPLDGVTTSAIPVTIQVQDTVGNLISNYSAHTVTLNSSSNFVIGTGVVSLVNGTATVNLNDQKAEMATLSLQDTGSTGLNVSSTKNIIFAPGTATKFVMFDPIDGTILNPINVTVQAQDAFGNKNSGYNQDVMLMTLGSSATGGGRIDIVNGEGSLAIADTVPETVQLTLADSFGTGLNITSNQDVYFAPGTPVKFAFIQPPAGTTDGPIYVTVEAQDSHGSKVPSYTGHQVTVNASGSVLGGRALDILDGKGVIALYGPVAGTFALTLTDTYGTGLNVSHTINITYTAGLVRKIIIVDPADSVVRSSVPVTIKAVDVNNDIVQSYSGAFNLVLNGSATGGGAFQLVNGITQVTIGNWVAQTTTLSLTDSIGTGLDVTSTQTMVWSPGAPAIAYPTCSTLNYRTDQMASCNLYIYDIDWNHIPTFSGSYNVVVNGSARIDTYLTGPQLKLVNVVNGVGPFSVYNTVIESITLLGATTGSLSLINSGVNLVWQAGIVTEFVILDPTDSAAGTSVPVTVEARNANGVKEPTYTGVVYLRAGGSATGGGYVVISSGVGTVNVNDNTIETINLTLEDVNNTGYSVTSTQNLNFGAAAATKLVVIDPTDAPWNVAVPVTVRALTANNIVDTSYSGTVTLGKTGSATVSNGGTVNISSGSGTINVSDTTAETVTLSLSASSGTGLNISSTQNLVFSNPIAHHFAIINPVDGTTDNPITVYVHALDANNNIVPNYQSDVTLNADGVTTGTGLVNIVNGIGSLNISNTGAKTVNLSLADTQSTGLDVSSVQNVVFGVGVPTQFVIVDPTDGERGGLIPVTVRALNAANNIVTSYSGNVELRSSGSGSVSGIVILNNGVGTVNVTDAIAETVTLSLYDYFSTGYNVSSTQNLMFSAGVATQFVIIDPTDSPWNVTVPVTVQARTVNNLLDTAYQLDVSLLTSGSAVVSQGTVNIVNGIGSATVSDTQAETVTLSLSDTQNTLLNVSSTQNLVFSNPVPTKIVIIDPVDGNTESAVA